ncbi:outer dynein arm-docking complex subunit 4 [Gadus macrocephalus]|uniref:outer dynein arm-docking complex subunit 4 n=1 Tax=Gadus macrocephalus TaxID=80720 RepID=UPI0028CB45C8|nr:outer dynein arm-docking complex subunit 4 [Gadus macrocephalus]
MFLTCINLFLTCSLHVSTCFLPVHCHCPPVPNLYIACVLLFLTVPYLWLTCVVLFLTCILLFFVEALILKPEDKNCFVARSRCYLKMGDTDNALSDAETSLKEDKEFFKGLYQKAEALYTMGDLEFALVFYHRGRKLRPELEEFRLGIQKAQEAIENSVGKKLENKEDLSSFCKGEVKKGQPVTATQPQRRHVKQQSQKSAKVERSSKQLLGELYSDKEYLEKLLKDEDLAKVRMRGGECLQDLILHSVGYLDRRIDFWRQQKLIYARERDRKLMQEKWSKGRLHSSPSDPTQYVLKSLEEIDGALTSGNLEWSLKEARHVMRTVQGWPEEDLPNRNEVLANLHSCIGNALMDLGKMDQALTQYQKSLQLAIHSELPDAKSQALDNIGRVYAHTGKFSEAINVWEEKIPLVRDSVEKTWLFYEIGRCYLELKRHTEAREYGCRSLDTAEEIGDDKWLLNASVLVAQADLHLGDFQSSTSHFEEALKRAKMLKDDSAVDAVQKALFLARQNSVK